MGLYRRSVRVSGRSGAVSADMEDDFHRFGIDLTHDGGKVTSIRGRALRTPWNTCRLAPNALSGLEGLPLQPCPSDFVLQTNPRAQCTHMYELAALAGSHVLRDHFDVEYAAVVPYPIEAEPARATLHRNGELLLDWLVRRPAATGPHDSALEHRVAGDEIVSPAPFAGRRLATLMRWAREQFSPDLYDAIYVLRRAVGISAARIIDLDAEDTATLVLTQKSGDCFAFQPEHRATTLRERGSTLNFGDRAEALLRDLAEG